MVAFADHESRSTWACELKWNEKHWESCGKGSRSTWACELKSLFPPVKKKGIDVTLHVSVWVEIFETVITLCDAISHAPRERVSWNLEWFHWSCDSLPSRSTWACELKLSIRAWSAFRVWSRSTWACELKLSLEYNPIENYSSRSTWACELKWWPSKRFYCFLLSRSTWACELK